MIDCSHLMHLGLSRLKGSGDLTLHDNDNCDDRDRNADDRLNITSMDTLEDTATGNDVPEMQEAGSFSSKSHDATTQKRRCAVCKGLATGYHYGVASCEACKAFFKRTIQKNLSYSCFEERRCEISHGKKRQCQACRYDKCIQAGMLVNSVRLNRIKGGRQEYRRRPDERDFSPATTGKKRKYKSAMEFSQRLLEIEPEAIKIQIPEVVKEYFSKIDASSNKTSQVRPGMQLMAEITDRALITTVRWAKKIPGFEKLCLNDQMALLCNSWMEILLINVIHRNSILPGSDEVDCIVFARGLEVNREDMSSPGRMISPLIFEQIKNAVNRLRSLKLSKAIVVILKAMVLFNAGPSLSNRLPLKSQKEIQEIQAIVHDALHYRIQQEHPGDTRLVYHLMMLLPLIKDTALTVSSLVWDEFNRERVPMQELLREVLQPILETSERKQPRGCCHGDRTEASQPEQPAVKTRVKLENTLIGDMSAYDDTPLRSQTVVKDSSLANSKQ